MAAIAICSNCQANFTDKDEVASILGAPPHHCIGCASFAAANPEQAAVEAHVEQTREDEAAEEADPTPANIEHVEGDLLVTEPAAS